MGFCEDGNEPSCYIKGER